MAARNFDLSLQQVLRHEGGFSNHKKDPGGATNKGITLAIYKRFINRNGKVDDLKRITDEQVARVYKRQYWDKVKGDELPDGVDFAVFDFAVNSGPLRAAKHLQRVIGAHQDGQIGPLTLEAARSRLPSDTINRLLDDRLAFLKGLRTWKTFGRGWATRVGNVRRVALEMARAPAERVPDKPVPTTTEPTGNASSANSGGLWAALAALIARLFKRKD